MNLWRKETISGLEPGRVFDLGAWWRSAAAGPFTRAFARTVLWQGVGKLVQVIGVAYAARCLGAANLGLSGTVMVVAAQVQLALDFGLDIVAVRHIAARSARLEDLVSALFTLRLVLALAAGGLWLIGVMLVWGDGVAAWVWGLGAVYLAVLVLNFNWFYQATERIPRLSLIQLAVSLTISFSFLVLFKPGQAAGSDLAVTIVVNAAAGFMVWWHIRQLTRTRLFSLSHLGLAWQLLAEGRPNWLFNLAYYLLSSMSLPLVYWLLGDYESGLLRSAFLLASSFQLFLNYLAYMLNPRIVIWRERDPTRFYGRIVRIVASTCLAAMAGCTLLWAVHRPLYQLVFGPEYMPAAWMLPILLFSKFLAFASGVVVWSLFACRKDWLTVLCCLPSIIFSFGLHIWLLPRLGVGVAAWLTGLSEFGLLIACLWALRRVAHSRLAIASDEEPSR